MSDPVKHHFVPVFYLSKWADQDGYVTATRRASDGGLVTHRVKPKETAFEKNLYALEKVAPEHRQVIEKNFFANEIDDRAAPLHARLLAGEIGRFSQSDRDAWTHFIMAQRLRVPEIVKDLRGSASAQLRTLLDGDQKEFLKLRGNNALSFSEWTENQFVGLIDNFGMTMLPKIVTDPEFTRDISALHWWVEDVASANVTLLTSDRPLWMSAGLAHPNCLLALPLSPTAMFFASRNPDMSVALRHNGPNKLVRRCNESIASQHARFVYGAAEMQFLARRMPKKE